MFFGLFCLEQRRVKGKWKLDVIVRDGGERNGGQGTKLQ